MRSPLAPLLALALLACGCTSHAGGGPPPGTGGTGGEGGGPPVAEICDNGVDDDGNGQTDCQDAACAGTLTCPPCGNGKVDAGEQCDGAELNNESCVSRGYNHGGKLACNADCTFDESQCKAGEDCTRPGDEDHNGLADCADPACASGVACLTLALAHAVAPVHVSAAGSIALLVSNGLGQPVSNMPVVLAAPPGAVAPADPVQTGANGVATFAVRAGRLAGTQAFHATVSGTDLALDVTLAASEPPEGTILSVLNFTHTAGDDTSGPASAARVGGIVDLQVASDSTVYAAEACRILAISPEGVLSSIAGSGACGTPEDGSMATHADLGVWAMVLDDVHHVLYAADREDARVYAVDLPTGILSIIAGGGSKKGRAGDGAALRDLDLQPLSVALAGDGALLVADANSELLFRLDRTTGKAAVIGKTARADSRSCGDVLELASVDTGFRALFDAAGTTFLLGSFCGFDATTNQLGKPAAVRLDATGPVAVAGLGAGQLGGVALASRLALPGQLQGTFDGGGSLFGATESQIVRIDGETGRVSILAGSSFPGFAGEDAPAFAADFSTPAAVAFGPGGDLYVADTGNLSVRRITAVGSDKPQPAIVTILDGDGQSGQLASRLTKPLRFHVTDAKGLPLGGQPVAVLPPDATTTIYDGQDTDGGATGERDVRLGLLPGALTFLAGVPDIHGGLGAAPVTFRVTASTPAQGEIFTLMGEDHDGLQFLPAGVSIPAPHANLTVPIDVVADTDGSVYLTEGDQVMRLDAPGTISRFAGGPRGGPAGDGGSALDAVLRAAQAVASDSARGGVYIVDVYGNSTWVIRKVDVTTGIIDLFAGGGPGPPGSGDGGQALDASFDNGIDTIAVDPLGKVYVSGYQTGVRVIDPATGIVQSFVPYAPCGTGPELIEATAFVFDGAITYLSGPICDGAMETWGVLRRDADGSLTIVSDKPCMSMAMASDGRLACGYRQPDDQVAISFVDLIDPATGEATRLVGGGDSTDDHVAATSEAMTHIRDVAYFDGHLVILADAIIRLVW